MAFRKHFIIYSMLIVISIQMINFLLSISSFEKVYRNSVIELYEILINDVKDNIENGLNWYKRYNNYVGIDIRFSELLERSENVVDSIIATDKNGKLLYLSYSKNSTIHFKKFETTDKEFINQDIFVDAVSSKGKSTVIEKNGVYLINTPVYKQSAWQGNLILVVPKQFVTQKVYDLIHESLFSFILTLSLSVGLLIIAAVILLGKNILPGENFSSFFKLQKKRSFFIIITVLIINQGAFSFFNLKTFHHYYLEAIKNKAVLLSELLQEDVEYYLAKGISINKLINIETIMKKIVSNAPEYSNLSITDAMGNILYHVVPGKNHEINSLQPKDSLKDVTQSDKYHIVLNIADPVNTSNNTGYIKLAVNKKIIQSYIQKISLDYLSTIIIAILISLELTNFFISKSSHSQIDISKEKRSKPRIPISMIRNMGFLSLFPAFLFMPFFPLLLQDLSQPIFGLSKSFMASFPISIYMFASTAGFIIKDKLCKHFGYRTAFMTGSLVFSAGLLLTGLSNDIVQITIFQIISGIGFGIIYLVPQSLVMSFIPAEKHKLAFSNLFSGYYGGIICGSAIGGILAERFGYPYVFFLAAFISIISYIFSKAHVLNFIHQDTDASSVTEANISKHKQSFWKLLKDRQFLLPLLFQGIPYQLIYVGFLFFLLPLFLDSIYFSESDTGRIIMLHGLVIICGPFIIRFFSRFFSDKKLLILTGFVTGTMLISAWFIFGSPINVPFILILIPWIVIIAVCNCIQSSGIVLCSMNAKTAQNFGTGYSLSIYRIIERIGNVSAPLLCGFLIACFTGKSHGSHSYLFAIACVGIIFFICTIVFALFYHKNQTEE